MNFSNSNEEMIDEFYQREQGIWDSLGQKKTADTVILSTNGNLRYNCAQFRYRFDDFDGDVVFFDQNWIASGSCIHTNLRLNFRTQSVWSLDYNSAQDTVTLFAGTSNAAFANVRSGAGGAQVRISVPQNRIIFVVRKPTPFPGECILNPGSSIIVNG